MGRTIGGKTVSNGLVLALDAANKLSYPGSGTAWKDLSGNNNTGTLTNGPTFSANNQGSIVFDGTNDYVDIANSTSLNPSYITLMSWIKITSFSANQNIFNKPFTSLSEPYLSYALKMDGISSPYNTIAMEISVSGTRKVLTSTTTLNSGQWYLVVGTYNGSTLKLYINGNQEANTTSASGTISSYSTALQIGRSSLSGGFQYFNGYIANTLIYNRALSATEVLQNYNVNKSRFGL